MDPADRTRGYQFSYVIAILSPPYPDALPRWNSQLTYMERTCGKETIQPLRAPSIESGAMGTQQCFEMVYNRLRSKLRDYPTTIVISVLNDHFRLSAITAEQEPRHISHAFHISFSDVENLIPTAFFDRNENNQTQSAIPCSSNTFTIRNQFALLLSH